MRKHHANSVAAYADNAAAYADNAAARANNGAAYAGIAASCATRAKDEEKMIDEMQVRNLALIREAAFLPSRGLTVFTGETGAGKTALLSACKLLMGARADKSMIREGSDVAQVSGRFFLPARESAQESEQQEADQQESERQGSGRQGRRESELQELGEQQKLDGQESEREVVVTRRLASDGRSRVSIDGEMASVSELARTIEPAIDLCGQHEHQALAKPANHLRLLDAWAQAEVSAPLAAYREAYGRARQAAIELDRIQTARTASDSQLDEARFTLKQIDAVNPEEGEYESLAAFLAKAENAEALARAADGAHQALSGEGGALDGLSAAIAALDEGARFDESLAPYAQSLREAGFVLEDVARDVLGYRDGVEFDFDELAQAQERMSALQGLLRSYGPRMQDVLAARDAAREAVSLVDDAQERERVAVRALDEAELALAQAARVLHEVRVAASKPLADQVSAVMARLEMGSAELVCAIDMLPRDSWTAAGPSSVEFFFRPGAGMQARPLARIASGGEMSRVMLAVHVVMGERDNVSTLVFDEVDAGVGGATAVALAAVLAGLARTHQVLVVTHLAQVAVAADTHYVVQKSEGDVPETSLREVRGEERVREVERMLSGSTTETSLAHARELLGD